MDKEQDIQIRKVESEDIADILKLQYEAYQSEALLYNNFSIQPLTQTLEQALKECGESRILKAVCNGEIVGSVRAHEKEGTVHIGKLMVLPKYQNRGVGKLLMQAIESEFPGRRFELFTGAKSTKNLVLYEKSGYVRFKEEEEAPGLVMIFLEKRTASGGLGCA